MKDESVFDKLSPCCKSGISDGYCNRCEKDVSMKDESTLREALVNLWRKHRHYNKDVVDHSCFDYSETDVLFNDILELITQHDQAKRQELLYELEAKAIITLDTENKVLKVPVGKFVRLDDITEIINDLLAVS